mgnify:CR=1 FL=1
MRAPRAGRLGRAIAAVAMAASLLSGGLGGVPASAEARTESSPAPSVTDEKPTYQIRIVPGSTIHLVSKSSMLPISIRNDYDTEVRVQVHVVPGNLKAIIPATIEVTVPALTSYVAQVPITALADGEVPLKAWITTFSGIRMGKPVDLQLVITAEVEQSLIAGFFLVVAALGVAGLTRTLAKRRRANRNDARTGNSGAGGGSAA